MPRPKLLQCILAFATMLGCTASVAVAQNGTLSATALPARCAGLAGTAAAVSSAARTEATQLTGRAQAASIQGDNNTATTLYQRAAQLDPADPAIAYALGREYEVGHDARAMREYCRFLALAPSAPEAADVRQRIAELALALPPDTAIVRVPVAAPEHAPSPAGAFVTGLIIPGMGQFMTHRPVAGFLIMASGAGALAYGLQTKTVVTNVTHSAVDPLGHTYQYTTPGTQTERPYLPAGVAAAAGISLFAAFEAYNHARAAREAESKARAESRVPRSLTPMVAFGAGSMGLGLSLH